MPKHVKPTQAELDENIKKSLEEADKLKPKVESVIEPVEIPDDIEPSEPPKSSEPEPDLSLPDPEPEPSEPAPEPTPSEPPKPSPDYKKKFSESSSEAQILFARNKAVNEAIIQAKNLPDPTEEELQAANPEWEVMSDFERKTAKANFINERRWKIVDESTKPFVDMEKWAEEVRTFVGTEANLKNNPGLAGKEDQFVEYATRVTKSGVPFEVLIPAFLHSEGLKKTEHKGGMFPTGVGGPNDKIKPKSDKISVEQGRQLRQTDYNKWKEMLKAGKIESE